MLHNRSTFSDPLHLRFCLSVPKFAPKTECLIIAKKKRAYDKHRNHKIYSLSLSKFAVVRLKRENIQWDESWHCLKSLSENGRKWLGKQLFGGDSGCGSWIGWCQVFSAAQRERSLQSHSVLCWGGHHWVRWDRSSSFMG